MPPIPPDWNDDPKLWDALGRLPQERPATDFTYRVRLKLQEGERRVSRDRGWTFLRSWRWGVSMTLAAACGVLLVVIWTHFPDPKTNGVVEVKSGITSEMHDGLTAPVEVAQLAQDYELIQDLDVIERLDEL